MTHPTLIALIISSTVWLWVLFLILFRVLRRIRQLWAAIKLRKVSP